MLPWQIMELLRAATWAPSALNQQPWAFLVISRQAVLRRSSDRAKRYLLEVLPRSLELHWRSDQLTDEHNDVFHGAGTLIVIYARPVDHHPAEDCCLAAQNLMLAAQGMGLGTCPIGFVRPWLDLPQIKEELGVPAAYAAVMPIVVGWPAESSRAPQRTPPEIVNWMRAPD